ncbi:MAG TPA: CBS domain-containing protein [Flavisolibacter sp.]|nr:CBS domain-containing protein [Flavisolibacter sp.]
MERIADVLARKYPQFNTVVPDCLVSDALYQMCSENVDYLIVLENDKFLGIISDHDIASRILFEERPLNRIPVREFMSRTLPVTTPENSLEQCMQLMERYSVRHLAIFDHFVFRGVVSSHDLMQEALARRNATFEEEVETRQGYPWNY